MKIIITLEDNNGNLITKKEAIDSFETAEENLGKLERYWKQCDKLPFADNESIENFEEVAGESLDSEIVRDNE